MKEEEGMPEAEKEDEEEEEAKEHDEEKEEAKKHDEEEEEEKAEKHDDDKMKKFEMIVKKKDAQIEAMQKQMAELEASIANMTRKASLAEAGIDGDTADKLIAKFAGASNEMFATVVELAKSQAEPITEDFFDGEQEDEVSASELEEAEGDIEPSLAEAGEEPKELEMSTASEWFGSSVLKLNRNTNQQKS